MNGSSTCVNSDAPHPSVDKRQLRIVIMGRRAAGDALHECRRRGHTVSLVVAARKDPASTDVLQAAAEHSVPVVTDAMLYEELLPARSPILRDVDLVISYLYKRRLRPEMLALPRIGAFNFHAGPLPEARGIGCHSFAILEGWKEYGASVHWMSPEFDTGDLVRVERFPIADDETACSLLTRAYSCTYDLFLWFLGHLESGQAIPRTPQGDGRYYSRQEMEQAKRILPGDSPAMVDRRARAFWNRLTWGPISSVTGNGLQWLRIALCQRDFGIPAKQ